MFPTPVAVVLTAAFLVTGAIGTLALVRRARVVPGPCGDTRATEVLHLLMSVAMIAMAWGWTGGPDTPTGIAQLLVFGGFAAVLGTLGLLGLVGALPRRRDARGARLSHGLMAAAMVWMVATMPLLMHVEAEPGAPQAGPSPSHGAMSHGMDHGATTPDTMTAMPTAPGSGATGWASGASTVLVVLLALVGVAWVVRAAQLASPAHQKVHASPLIPAPRPEPQPARVVVGVAGAAGPLPAAERRSDAAAASEAASIVEPVTPGALARPAVLAASCHALMGLGMAGMLAAML